MFNRVRFTSSSFCIYRGSVGIKSSPIPSAFSSINSLRNFLNFSWVSCTTTSVPQMTSLGPAVLSLVGAAAGGSVASVDYRGTHQLIEFEIPMTALSIYITTLTV